MSSNNNNNNNENYLKLATGGKGFQTHDPIYHNIQDNISYFGLPRCGSVVKSLPAKAGDIRDASSIPGSGRSPGEGHGNPL